MILKLLTLILAILVFSKYVFNAKIHEKYIFGVTVLLAFFSNFGNKYSAIEMFDGSSVAFDKEAFENLNRVVNEIAGEGKLTIPGNLIVQGTAQFDGKVTCKNTAYIDKNIHCKQSIYGDNLMANRIKTSTSTQKWQEGNSKTLVFECPVKVSKSSTFESDCTLNKKLTVKDKSTFGGNAIFSNFATFNKDLYVQNLIPTTIKSSTTLGGFTNGNTKTVEIQCPLNTSKTIKKNSKEVITHDDTLYFLNTQQTNNNRDDCGKISNKYLRFEHGGNSDGCEALGMYGNGKAIIQVKKVKNELNVQSQGKSITKPEDWKW
jgi:hypothetical protein